MSTSLISDSIIPEPIVCLDRILIRSSCESDAESIAKYANNRKIAMWLRDAFPHPYTIEDAQKWIAGITNSSTVYLIVLRETNTVIGSVGLKLRTDVEYRTMEIGYWLGEEFWGRGIATEAVSAFTKWTFKTFDHVLRIEAEVYDGNEPSGRVLQKAGFEFEGRRRKAAEKWGVVKELLISCCFRDGV